MKRTDTGEHFVKEDAERKNVRAVVRPSSAHLLRRHVADRAKHHTGHRWADVGEVRRFKLSVRLLALNLGEPKVEELELAAQRYSRESAFGLSPH